MGELTLRNVSIRYGTQRVIEHLDLQISDGEMVSILGPSGVGKTTILKAVAGLLEPEEGEILINGRSVRGLPPEKRDAVMVFQKPLLFPFMNVEQNIAFGLRMQGRSEMEIRRHIDQILELTHLKGLGRRKVHELSGGQQQRVSLARALVLDPAVLLLDEPLSNLDANLRHEMRELIRGIQNQTRVTMLFVTHDQSEALTISHRVCLLLNGRVRQAGSPRDLFYRPVDPEVARFFGGTNFFGGALREGVLFTEFGSFRLPRQPGSARSLTATIRPEDIIIAQNGVYDLQGVVRRTRFEGSLTRLWVESDKVRFVVLTPQEDVAQGQKLRLLFPPEKIHIFPNGDHSPETG